MKSMSLAEVRRAVAGKPLTTMPDGVAVTEVSTDSRMCRPGSLFVAIRGEKFDAHKFLRDVAGAGAVAALVEDVPADLNQPNLHLIQVPDTRKALGKLAGYARQQLSGKVVAVAGSNGKTGTKHLIHAALSHKLSGSYSPKSFNNDIGVPLTILPADPLQDYLVLEMGTNNPGEIRTLATMARPDVAVITNCSAEHLQGLGDLIGVRRENACMVEGLDPAQGVLVVNGDDPELLNAVAHWKGRRVTFGMDAARKKELDLFASDVEMTEAGVRFTVNGKWSYFIPLLGAHTACNALAAIAVARRLGLTEEEIAKGLAHADGPDMRLQLQPANGVTILNDAYNANPASMRAALDTAARLPTRGRRIAVLGDMLELGRSSERFHREIGQAAAEMGFYAIACVGPYSKLIAESAIAAGLDESHVSHFADSATAAGAIPRWLDEGDLVLLKGSRSMRLEKVASAIFEARGVAVLRSAS
ncbi:MAG: UDP-N-acetylmuramoyl-tripeptide--D-alanyl-D-alanine ligase [Phycisphaerae bacterium]|nr:UDP-N-acetylmuramoyl-tripeptide--D-alanyl-D-alanine ligase [Tepidisphaeraceae bacterium]